MSLLDIQDLSVSFGARHGGALASVSRSPPVKNSRWSANPAPARP